MSKLSEFLHTQKQKIFTRPYTIYPDSNIKYFTEFQNGFASALVEKYGRYCLDCIAVYLIDTSFKPVILTQYYCNTDAAWINWHIIAVNKNHPDFEKWVFLDKELKEVPDKKFASIQYHGDCFIVSNRHRQYGILDKDLKEILPLKYSKIAPLSSTRFYCKSNDDNPSIVFDCVSGKIYSLEGVTSIFKESENGFYKFVGKKDKMFGYLNHEFQIVIEPKYNSLGEFDKNGFAPFARDSALGTIDQTGKEFLR